MSLFPKKIPIKSPNRPAPAPSPTSMVDISQLRQQALHAQIMREREEALRRQQLPEAMVVGALSGWRRWSVEMFGEILLSNNRTKWEPRKKLVAECKRRGLAAYMRAMSAGNPFAYGPTPDEDVCHGIECGCGIYAYKYRQDLETQENAPTHKTHIFGEVWLWGRIVEHHGGYRAQYAYPKAFVRCAIAERLAYVYGAKLID